MRKHRWIAPVWGMLAAAAVGQTASAQPPGPLDGPFPPAGPAAPIGPVGPGVAPPPAGGYAANPTYTPIAPDAASPAGFPPGMRPWPAISPYENAVDSTYNDNGIWFREILGQSRRYHLTADFISGRYRQPGNAIIGADVIKSIPQNLRDEPQAAFPPQTLYGAKDFDFRQASGRYFVNPTQAGNGGGGTTNTNRGNLGFGPRPVTTYHFGPLIITGVNSPSRFEIGIGTTSGNVNTPFDFTYDYEKAGLAPVVSGGLSPLTTTIGTGTGTGTGTTPTATQPSGTQLYTVSGGVLAPNAVNRFGGDPNVVGEKSQNPASPGLRMVFGAEEEDKSGFDITGFWLSDQAQVFRRGLDDPNRMRLTNVVLFESALPASVTSGTGLSDERAFEVLDYNRLFEVRNDTTTTGTDLALYHTPVVDYGWLVIRPLWGARYNYIRETFGFTGRDNGLFAAYNNDGSPTLNQIYLQNAAFSTPGVVAYSLFPYETSVTSRVQSHLYGPQVGMDLHMGGEYFMVTSAAKTGVLVNTERLTMGAYGFGLQEAFTGQRAFFGDSKGHTRAAPFVEFNANLEANVFPIIPYLNRWDFFKNARLRGGWNTLVVGNVQRPIDQIVWRSESAGGPYIKERGRDAWYVQYWNVGVDWRF